ncbi:hypothetical protein CAG70_17695 [Photobacterium halotolerans]|uniref:hypothetical protein n=1 Tax=Photobacterium halotolerans TaxID=265726 RepID=UPI00137290A7|nr:hypothetical protein [Photobacterium halotolerans]NAX48821.1 hypothetical protein [Photobacterium halotolerans]
MIDKVTHVKNPLTVIAMFAGIAEISGTIVLPFVDESHQGTFIWFLMLFPAMLVGVFFATLNFNHKVLYAPSDYKDEENFLKLFGFSEPHEQYEKIREELNEDISDKSLNSKNLKLSQAILAEKLSLMSISKKMNLTFKPDVKFKTPSGRYILFDGVAIDGAYVHAFESKLFTHKSTVKNRVKKAFIQAYQLQEEWQGVDARKLIFHLYIVIDSADINELDIKKQVEELQANYSVRLKVEVVSLEDLKNEWQFG